MKIELAEIGPGGKEVELSLTQTWLASALDGSAAGAERQPFPYQAVSDLQAYARLQRIGLDVLVEGDVRVKLRAECSACLKEFDLVLPVSFRLALQPISARKQATLNRQELTQADLEEAFYEGEAIELDDILREQILLALPMVPRCTEECRGLCPECGADRNLEPCQCASGGGDPRWAGLLAIKTSTSQGEESP